MSWRPAGASADSPSTALVLIAMVSLFLLAPSQFGLVSDTVTIGLAINVVLVVGLYIFVGNSGILSFGHMAFAAIGAYVAAILTIPVATRVVLQPGLPDVLRELELAPWLAVLVGASVGAAVALILAYPLMRLGGLGASLATFGVLVIVNTVANNWEGLTNGASGVAGVPKSTSTGGAVLTSVVAILAAYAFQRTGTSLRLRATREDEVSAQTLGVRVIPERAIGWVLSAFIVGIGGALMGQHLGSFGPSAFYLDLTFLTLAMLVVGGMTSLSGAVVGALGVGIAGELLRQIERGVDLFGWQWRAPTGLREVALAVAMLAILIRRPRGLTGGREIAFRRSPPSFTQPMEDTTQESPRGQRRTARPEEEKL